MSDRPNVVDRTRPYFGFEGTIRRTMAGSDPAWPTQPTAPGGAPNIVFVLVDDVGFADVGCFGSEIRTPNIDRLARDGVRFTNFHVNPMCSPTRASLLTGVNCHAAGVGHVSQSEPGYPGYRSELANNVATAAEILRAQGYATLMVGKWHLAREQTIHSGGPQDGWPLQRGFDRYYGILDAFTNLHHPHRLVRDNTVVQVDRYPDGYFLTDDLTDEAITMIRDRKANRPNQPFFLYFAHPAAHAPLHAKAADIESYRGMYDSGWDEIRAQRHARQIELGITPDGTRLAPRNGEPGHDVEPWDDLTPQAKEVYARYMEVFAAMVDEIDQSVGRLRTALEQMGEWENTLVVFLSDNGASREGEVTGTTNYYGKLTSHHDTVEVDHARLAEIGGPTTMSHYPRGWAMAGNTPFRLYKKTAHAGAHQVPCVVSWPAGLAEHAATIRTQYAHVVDVLPTVLELAGLDTLTARHGERLKLMNGASLTGVLADANHDEVRTEQYYEIEGHRAIYRDGFEAVTLHEPRTAFGDHEWELFDLRADPTQTDDLAAGSPERVAEMATTWEGAARANQVYPLDEGSNWRYVVRPPGQEEPFELPVTIWPGTPTLERLRSFTLLRQRDVDIIADIDHTLGAEGVLVAHGDQGGGYSVEVREDAAWYVHNDGEGRMTRVSFGTIGVGHHTVRIKKHATADKTWVVTCDVDGEARDGEANVSSLGPMSPFTGIDVGIDRISPIDWERHAARGPFPYAGALNWVRFEPGALGPQAPTQYVDLLREIGSRYE
jgi:arylsulfatase A-like enzyme